ncbi:hypothetical protein FrCorBMG51_13200 [Protofrankia coriariae]|uniref:Uncharacterized protein n=1 Tax=Protofrankia coriariae TaxID=1562887 RepID=A0ABR5F3D8_9ACTN|nr:hypothetical protein FrCorBMG51_13200 [Protofrankia coriariae]
MQFAFAAAFFAIGRWGQRHAPTLVPASLSPEGRAKRERSLRRGARSCKIIAVFFVVLGVVGPVLPS